MSNEADLRRPIRAGLITGLAAAALVSLLQGMNGFRALENRLYDARVRWLAPRITPSPDVLIVALDDASLAELEPELGRWPWPRSVFAEIINTCSPARTIVMDVIFPEADARHAGDDTELIKAVQKQEGVVSAIFLDDQPRSPPVPPALESQALTGPPFASLRLLKHSSALVPFAGLLEASVRAGFINYMADPDGVHRACILLARIDDGTYPSLPLAAILQHLNLSEEDIQWERHQLLRLGRIRIPLDATARFAYMPGRTPHTTYSLSQVLRSARKVQRDNDPSLTRETFRDKIVFIGSTATGLQGDRLVTPLSVYTPGVQVMATATDNILHEMFFRNISRPAQLALILLLSLLPALRYNDRPMPLLITLATGSILYLGTAWLCLRFGHWMWPLTAPLAALLLAGSGLGTLRWTRERKQRKHLEALDRAKQEFTDMLVHDLRSQLAPVVMSLSLLDERTRHQPDPRMSALIGTSLNCVRRLVAQVSTLLDIRKIEEGRMPLILEPESAERLVKRVLEEYRPAAEKAGIGLVRTETLDSSVRVLVDADVFMRVLGNLIWNSIKYASPSSVIEVACEQASPEHVTISIANRGPVIPAAQQEQVFQPFTALSTKSRNIDISGTGLGLAFCRLAMEAHRGSIRLESPWEKTGDGVKITLSIRAEASP